MTMPPPPPKIQNHQIQILIQPTFKQQHRLNWTLNTLTLKTDDVRKIINNTISINKVDRFGKIGLQSVVMMIWYDEDNARGIKKFYGSVRLDWSVSFGMEWTSFRFCTVPYDALSDNNGYLMYLFLIARVNSYLYSWAFLIFFISRKNLLTSVVTLSRM